MSHSGRVAPRRDPDHATTDRTASQSLRQTGRAKGIGDVLEVLGTLEREPFTKVGEPECRIELAKLLHREPGLFAASGMSINGG